MMKWLINNGSKIDKAKIHRFDDGHQGVIALQDINENETFAVIPYKLLITQDLIRNGTYRKLIQRNHQLFNEDLNEDSDFNVLVFYVMLEKLKKENSFYFTYFKGCEDIQNMFSWSQDKLDSLVDEEIQKKFMTMQVGLQKNYSLFQTLFSENSNLPQISYDLFLESYQFVMTRCYAGGKDTHLSSTCLVPFGDSMNHYHSQQTSYFLVCPQLEKEENHPEYVKKTQLIDLSLIGLKSQGEYSTEDFEENFDWVKKYHNHTYLAIYAQQRIKKGEEIFNFFGEKDNTFLLLWYGFCYQENIYDKVKFYINKQDPQQFKFYPKRSELSNYIKISLNRFELNEQLLNQLQQRKETYRNLLDELLNHYQGLKGEDRNHQLFYQGKINVLIDQKSLL